MNPVDLHTVETLWNAKWPVSVIIIVVRIINSVLTVVRFG